MIRDATRGGVGTVLYEIAAQSGVGVNLDAGKIPVDPAVKGVCGLLGLEPLYLACEGRLVMVCPEEKADLLVDTLRSCKYTKGTTVIGRITDTMPGRVNLSPETRVYSNLSPSMLLYKEDSDESEADKGALHIALGRDAGWYHPDYPCLLWGEDIQPFGFMGVCRFFEALMETAKGRGKDLYGSAVRLVGEYGVDRGIEEISRESSVNRTGTADMRPKGYREVLTPFAPDQSGAVSVFYELGGITVICDAGGCTGNICGFDEPRWFRERSAV